MSDSTTTRLQKEAIAQTIKTRHGVVIPPRKLPYLRVEQLRRIEAILNEGHDDNAEPEPRRRRTRAGNPVT